VFQISLVSAAGLNTSQSLSLVAGSTATPIKHVIVIIGENHTFDNVFGTFQPSPGQTVSNLLTQGIVTCNGSSGPNVGIAAQQQATDTTTYSLTPTQTGPYTTLPQPDTTYAQGQPQNVPDARFPANLPNGPFQITKYVPYLNSYVGDPLHRFYQMWQEQDGGKHDLYTWVPNTAGDDNGANPPAAIHQGGLDMGYYNMCTGDAPNFNFAGQQYAISQILPNVKTLEDPNLGN
jgi:phospholipase C